jgi:quercetin 2,3-dioxygenase
MSTAVMMKSPVLLVSDVAPNSGPDTQYFRSVRKVMPRPEPHWVGDGFRVYPVFADVAFTNEISPLLMFDYGEPKTFPARPAGSPPLGVGQHPHRGFETVTLAFQGEVEHRDNKGNCGVIGPGDVQWMTAGRGIIHEEYHSQDLTKNGGSLEVRGFQSVIYWYLADERLR